MLGLASARARSVQDPRAASAARSTSSPVPPHAPSATRGDRRDHLLCLLGAGGPATGIGREWRFARSARRPVRGLRAARRRALARASLGEFHREGIAAGHAPRGRERTTRRHRPRAVAGRHPGRRKSCPGRRKGSPVAGQVLRNRTESRGSPRPGRRARGSSRRRGLRIRVDGGGHPAAVDGGWHARRSGAMIRPPGRHPRTRRTVRGHCR